MAIPAFDGIGLLPPGAWDCSLSDIGTRFCWNLHRQRIWADCLRFIDAELRQIPLVDPVWIDGSFVRNKSHPSDVDLVVDCTSAPAEAVLQVMALRFRHAELKASYHVDLWHRHPTFPHDLTRFFQYAGDKCAAELSVAPKHPKGILRVRL